MGPGRTGVKGVIRDRDEAAARDRDRRARDAADLARRMEKASLGGKTFLEEERERQWEQALLEGAGALREAKGRFGHLREVGMRGFVPAVEEDGGVWVVVHIYAPSLERCDTLDDSLVRLARAHPETKFIRCRASAIGFATTPSSASHRSARKPTSNFLSTSSRIVEDEEDPYGDDAENGGDEEDLEDEEDEDAVDTDVLPTMLVYQGGELVHNWVRVDWEAGAPGVEDLLERHHVIQPRRMGTGNFGASLDDEEELRFNSDPDDF
ncbi:thioredoxin-like protein [Artomyces pyxidatus]|uniref:Thioredoxin-like protein n=1 Tax=Artomyces pyxidatus TaxID=48021 RepID=A0ACB8SHG3_9AGAM|nr:thioredoxin-like protein [Artomyces pyxidatus]